MIEIREVMLGDIPIPVQLPLWNEIMEAKISGEVREIRMTYKGKTQTILSSEFSIIQ